MKPADTIDHLEHRVALLEGENGALQVEVSLLEEERDRLQEQLDWLQLDLGAERLLEALEAEGLRIDAYYRQDMARAITSALADHIRMTR